MPGHLQEGFGCVVTNRFDQLLDDESDPFEILKAAENKKKEAAAAAAASGGSNKSSSSSAAAQAAKQPKKESQKDRKNPLLDNKKEESQAPVPLKKEGEIFNLALWLFISLFYVDFPSFFFGYQMSCCIFSW